MRIVLLIVIVCIGACGPKTPSAPPPSPPTSGVPGAPAAPAAVVIEGKLLGGIAAIGAETTGWAIEQPQSEGGVLRTEIDCVSVEQQAAALDGKQVRATGKWEERKYIERGVVRVLIVQKIEAAP